MKISFVAALILAVTAYDLDYSVTYGNFKQDAFWSQSPCKSYTKKSDMQFHATPSYLYTIDKFAINHKVQDWFEHVEYCVTKDD
jgi:hypothetical protein